MDRWMMSNIRAVGSALREVFVRPLYILLFISASAAIFVGLSLSPHARLLAKIFADTSISFFWKVSFMITLLKGSFSAVPSSSIVLLLFLAILLGLNIGFAAYLVRKRRSLQRAEVALSVGGIVSGAAGVGCIVCGSLALNLAFFLTGSAGFISFLPLKGREFGFIGILLLVVSFVLLCRNISSKNVCLDK